MIRNLLLVAVGGSLGSVLRYLVSVFTERWVRMSFPIGTFIVNILGCLLIGFLVGWFDKSKVINNDLRWLLITGFCGGFTTFSAFGYENIRLMQSGNTSWALIYILSSLIIGLLAVWLGILLNK